MARVKWLRVLPALMIVVAMAACGGTRSRNTAASGSVGKTGASGKATATAGANASTATTAKPKPATTAAGAQKPKPSCKPVEFLSPTRGEPGAPHIWVQPSLVAGWNCNGLTPGMWCTTRWSGDYLGEDAETYVQFVAWEHGKTQPVRKVLLGPLPLNGQFTNESTGFAYRVGKTDKVRFYLQLLNSAKAVVATSDTFVYDTTCRF